MMSLAWAHRPSMLGWPSVLRAGVKFGSSFGGFLGSIQPGGGGFFGGGGPWAAMRAPVADMIVPVSTNAITAPTDSLAICVSSEALLSVRRGTRRVTLVPAGEIPRQTRNSRIPGA